MWNKDKENNIHNYKLIQTRLTGYILLANGIDEEPLIMWSIGIVQIERITKGIVAMDILSAKRILNKKVS